ncbi:hypothetical protein Z517_09370 [Fonsecaea pedrosoi CBS 271.37]|uniref:Uncharacterized protein n=1 Tax=Fonsecaea pedrosoi CBS 271.37 TaxID=1442368 RepID=A0A0D2DGW9_9EURO|nr:uncharacterized protein Z517_09370 [Fonsecaea pedrosoi CBS 271.37]KIW76926.1 hypothetical protein Z517_09370 [Fonsecaea pedrosoi CBS 271.37]
MYGQAANEAVQRGTPQGQAAQGEASLKKAPPLVPGCDHLRTMYGQAAEAVQRGTPQGQAAQGEASLKKAPPLVPKPDYLRSFYGLTTSISTDGDGLIDENARAWLEIDIATWRERIRDTNKQIEKLDIQMLKARDAAVAAVKQLEWVTEALETAQATTAGISLDEVPPLTKSQALGLMQEMSHEVTSNEHDIQVAQNIINFHRSITLLLWRSHSLRSSSLAQWRAKQQGSKTTNGL